MVLLWIIASLKDTKIIALWVNNSSLESGKVDDGSRAFRR